MDERVITSVIIGAGLGALLGIGIGAIVGQFTDAPAWTIGAFIGAGLLGIIGWLRES